MSGLKVDRAYKGRPGTPRSGGLGARSLGERSHRIDIQRTLHVPPPSARFYYYAGLYSARRSVVIAVGTPLR